MLYNVVLISAAQQNESVVCVKVSQSCRTLCTAMDYSLPGSSVHGILQARILEWIAILSYRGSSQPRDQSWLSSGLCRGDSLHCRQILYCLSHREALPKLLLLKLHNFRIKTLNFKNHRLWEP